MRTLEKNKTQNEKRGGISRERVVVSLVAGHWRTLSLAMLCMVVVAGATSASAYLVKPMLDDIFVNRDRSRLLFIPVAAIVIFFLKGAATYGQQYWMNHVGQQVIKTLRNMLYDHIMDLPLAFFHQEKTGTLMSRITNDVNIVKGMVSTAVAGVLRDLFTVVGLVGVILYMDWKLALGAFAVLPLAFYPVVIFGRRVRRFSTGRQEAMADLNVFLHETFSGSKIVKTFTMEPHEKKRFHEKSETLFRLEMKGVAARALSSPVMEFMGGIGIAFIIWFGGSRVISGASTTGTFFSFLTAVMMLYAPVKKLANLNNTVQEGMAAVTRIFEIIHRQSDIIEADAPRSLTGDAVAVEFENVSFFYDPGDDPVLRDITLSVNPGEVLALVGMSGGGKTSLVNLIPRFYDVTAGTLRLNGMDVREIGLRSLRRQISIVTQEPVLFNDTVRNNIRYGNLLASDGEVESAARKAFAHDFIMGFPRGYDTKIGELGSRLSGGEKQRLCIARALIKDAPVLILDEATSALDSQAEQVVQQALANLIRGRTTFVIAHRLSTVDHAHRIVVLEKGRILEQGNHEDLMALKGKYHSLRTMQHPGGEQVKITEAIGAVEQ